LSRKRLYLLALAPSLLYLTMATLYLFAIPLGESPDEPGHLQCIQQVALQNRLPVVEPKPQGEWWKPGVTLSGRMCYHMPLYYVGAGLLQQAISALTGSALPVEFPDYNEAFGETGVMFLHPDKARLSQLDQPNVVLSVRVMSILLGLIVVWTTMATANLLFQGSPFATIVAGIWVAGWPQFLFLSRAISNDVLATALASVALVVLLQVEKPQRYATLAFLSALAVFSKVTMIFVVVAVALVWCIEFLQYPAHRKMLGKGAITTLIVWGVAATFVQLAPTLHTNFWSSARTFSAVNERVFQVEYWLEMLFLTLSSGWVRFGWMNVATPDHFVYLWWAIVVGLSICGAAFWWRSELPNRNLLGIILAIWVAGNLATYLRINMAVLQPQFRFLQSLLPILASFVAGGILCISPRITRYQIVIASVLIIIAIIMNIGIIWGVVLPHYGLST